MSNWYYDEPADLHATRNRRVVYSEDMIIFEHAHHCYGSHLTRERIIEDWVLLNWAARTNMPIGEYPSTNRREL